MKRVLLLFPFLLFSALIVVTWTAGSTSIQFKPVNWQDVTFPPRVNFPVQLILPQEDHGLIDLNTLNQDLYAIHRERQQPLAQFKISHQLQPNEEFRLTVIGHRWSAFRAPPARLGSSRPQQVHWVYLVRSDWAPIVRTRLAFAGWNWTQIFVSGQPQISAAFDDLSREEIARQSTTTQLRRWIMNYIDPVTNPTDYR